MQCSPDYNYSLEAHDLRAACLPGTSPPSLLAVMSVQASVSRLLVASPAHDQATTDKVLPRIAKAALTMTSPTRHRAAPQILVLARRRRTHTQLRGPSALYLSVSLAPRVPSGVAPCVICTYAITNRRAVQSAQMLKKSAAAHRGRCAATGKCNQNQSACSDVNHTRHAANFVVGRAEWSSETDK
ncbi:hypothetical protein BCV70DRAFT_66655 [Testicularia cyperi]|uniref:Uncharacterized protein n=1 Tax=Testicularia cyperi TaxID=1882483 RepID=A0A317XH91_9BASI|nr:hypothetical protein BCV70DRAFT_66655 [Testicularia cyperi]